MRQDSGRSFVIDDRPGAGGLTGAQIVAEAPPDGATVLFTTATLAVNTTLFAETLHFDPRRDLTPASLISAGPLVLCVHPSVPAKSVKDLIELARRHPGKLATGINEFGSTGHLAAEMLNQLAGINTTIVPYKGGGPALMGLLTGDVALLFLVAPVTMSQLEAKRIRGLAVTTPQRSAAFPGLPALKEIVPSLEKWCRVGAARTSGRYSKRSFFGAIGPTLRCISPMGAARGRNWPLSSQPYGYSPEANH